MVKIIQVCNKYFAEQKRNFWYPSSNNKKINKIIKELDSENATGVDLIPPKIMKILANMKNSDIAGIIDNDITNNVFSENSKQASVGPIFKRKGTRKSWKLQACKYFKLFFIDLCKISLKIQTLRLWSQSIHLLSRKQSKSQWLFYLIPYIAIGYTSRIHLKSNIVQYIHKWPTLNTDIIWTLQFYQWQYYIDNCQTYRWSAINFRAKLRTTSSVVY